jgi:hypothetical protein
LIFYRLSAKINATKRRWKTMLICEENRMKNLSKVLGAASVLALCAVAQAQDPAAMAPPAPGADVTVQTQTTVNPDSDAIVGDAAPDTMPTTGGAPIALALLGSMTAAGAFIARRKLSGSSA